MYRNTTLRDCRWCCRQMLINSPQSGRRVYQESNGTPAAVIGPLRPSYMGARDR